MSDFEPNADGLFGFAGVAALAENRECAAVAVSDLICKISGSQSSVDVVARQKRRWDPREIFAACTVASGRKIPKQTKPPTGLDTKNHCLREEAIAELVAADGVVAYRGGRRTVALESLIRTEAAGGAIAFGENAYVKAAVRCVVDAGLADLGMGPRGGWEKAILTWRGRARRSVAAPALTPEEDAAIGRIKP